ncbi:MAG: hypothetical protein ABGX16_20285 [Pirellulales bacterium]
MPHKNAFKLILTIAVTIHFAPNVMAVSFLDQNFFPQNWTPIIHVRDDPTVLGSTGLLSVGNMTRQSSGGSPNAYFRSGIGLDFGDIINTSGIYLAETYDPAERAITTLNFSYSVNHFSNTAGTETSVLPAILQDGRLFVASAQTFSGNNWVQRTQNNLDANDFFAVDKWFTGQTIRPDFSAFGDTIQFGYSLQNDVAFGPGFQEFRGLDNWSVNAFLAAMSDIHGDGVDNKDIGFWEAGYGITEEALLVDGDFNRNSKVDGADFLKWQREFGATSSLLTAVIPEPNTLSLMVVFGLAFLVAFPVNRNCTLRNTSLESRRMIRWI